MTMGGYFGGGGGFAEARDVGIPTGVSDSGYRFITAPRMISGRYFVEIGVSQFAVDAVDERAHFPRVDEKRVFAAVAETALGVGALIFREEPKADGNLGAIKKLAGECDHAVHEVGLDEGAADVTFTGLVGRHAAVG